MGLQLCVITFVFVVLFLRDILAVGNDLKAKKSLGTTYTVQYIVLYRTVTCTAVRARTVPALITVRWRARERERERQRERVVNSTATVGRPRK